MKKIFNKLFHFFLEGLLVIVPFGATVILVGWALNWTKLKIQYLFDFLVFYMPFLSKINTVPYLNIGVVILFITFLGYFASNFLVKSVLEVVEDTIARIPVINIIYSYVKDSTSAFMDKFNKPVLITVNRSLDIKKLGFITQESLDILPVGEGKIAVYVPHSYAFSGELVLVDRKDVAYLGVSSTDAFRLILSGGLANIETTDKTFMEIKKGEELEVIEEGDLAIKAKKLKKTYVKKNK